MTLHCVVTIDLSHPPENDDPWKSADWWDRRRLCDLDSIPNGTRVVVVLGERRYYTASAIGALRPHLDRLSIQIEGSAGTVARWYELLIGVSADVVA